MAVLGLRFCARAFSSCGKWVPLFIAVHGPLTVVASLVVEHGLQTRRLSSCGSRAQLLRGMWDLPRPGLEPMSPALAGGFFFFFSFNFFIYYLFIMFFIFGCAGSSPLCEGSLQLRRAGATLHRGARACHYRGLSCCGAEAPDAQAQ